MCFVPNWCAKVLELEFMHETYLHVSSNDTRESMKKNTNTSCTVLVVPDVYSARDTGVHLSLDPPLASVCLPVRPSLYPSVFLSLLLPSRQAIKNCTQITANRLHDTYTTFTNNSLYNNNTATNKTTKFKRIMREREERHV